MARRLPLLITTAFSAKRLNGVSAFALWKVVCAAFIYLFFFFSRDLDFVLSFSADALIPGNIETHVLNFIKHVYVFKLPPWRAAQEFLGVQDVLTHTGVVLTYRDGAEVHSRCLVLSDPPYNTWGIGQPFQCARPGCGANPFDLRVTWLRVDHVPTDTTPGARTVDDPHAGLSLKCDVCKTKTDRIWRPNWLHPVHTVPREEYSLIVYWHPWPIPGDYVTSLTSQANGFADEPDVPVLSQMAHSQRNTKKDKKKDKKDKQKKDKKKDTQQDTGFGSEREVMEEGELMEVDG